MSSTSRPVALVTGASSGIGSDLARELARDGHDLILVARRTSPMLELAEELARHGAKSEVIAADLAAQGAAGALVDEVRARGLTVDVLVNNAGFGDAALFHQAEPAKISEMLRLNVVALTELTRLVVAEMVARGRGRVMLVASTAAFQPGPGMAVYCATKAYVLSLGEAVAYELRGTGVTVTTLCPGPTRTGFAAAANAESNALFSKGGAAVMSAAAVARDGYRALKRGATVVVPGVLNKIGAVSGRFAPRAVSLPLARAMMAKR
jgi:short-subunit dehydrogenase